MNLLRNARTSVSNKRIGIAMSGGVDSTAAALMLRDSNTIQGFFMRLAQPDFDDQLERVSHLADKLSISLQVIDLREQFNKKVLDYFSSTYAQGRTPNPCMICNHEIKFGLFQEAILASGAEIMATGHYAQIVYDNSAYHLLDGTDNTKNQSYFLARLSQSQLCHTLFPLGQLQKADIFQFVKQHGFKHFDGVESQDICFLGNESVSQYLEKNHPQYIKKGPILSTEGQHLGEHTGLYRYTIGQRRGLGLPDTSPWYVAGIDATQNTLIVGKPDDLMKSELEIDNLHWISGNMPDTNRAYKVRIRYSHRGSMATLHPHQAGHMRLVFEEPQRAVTPGQFAVIYNESEVLGSGVIKI